jgi:cytochrome oxidase assembly protein ShyY1
MAETSPRRFSPWIAFLAGGVAMLALVLAVFGWWQAQRATQAVKINLRDAPALPSLPQTPNGPRLPPPPIPKPQ